MDSVLESLRSRLESALDRYDPYVRKIGIIVNYPIEIDQYLVYSTVISTFLTVMLMHKGVDIFLGYPIVVVNTLILLLQDRLIIHRNHAFILIVATVISFIASKSSGTPGISIIAQILGIVLFSTYFFSMLTKFGLSVPRWTQIYAQCALGMVVLGFAMFIARHLHLMAPGRDPRLTAIYPEPSLFVYATLPGFGIYVDAYLRDGRYKPELLIFFFGYLLADSSLGFLGMLLVAFFAALPRLNLWRMVGFFIAIVAAVTALFFASENFRLRVVDTALGIARMNIQHVNASTFAVLSNAYVTIQTVLKHPLIGVGLGGYQFAYTKYAPALNVNDPDLMSLNMFDASSLFLRTAAETGLLGLICLIGFLIVCSKVRGSQHVAIRNALMPYMLIRMGRYGAWFSLELYFFVGLFLLNYLHSRALYRPARRPHPATSAPHLI